MKRGAISFRHTTFHYHLVALSNLLLDSSLRPESFLGIVKEGFNTEIYTTR
jgi:hypothetical protein